MLLFFLLVCGASVDGKIQKQVGTKIQTTQVFSGDSLEIVCGQESDSFKSCHVKTPQDEYFMAFEGGYYKERRLRAIFQPFKCGVKILNVTETDAGVWECVATEQEKGSSAKFLRNDYNVTILKRDPLSIPINLTSEIGRSEIQENHNNTYLYIFVPLACLILIFIVVVFLNKKLSRNRNQRFGKAGKELASKTEESKEIASKTEKSENLDIESNTKEASKSSPVVSMKSLVAKDELNAE